MTFNVTACLVIAGTLGGCGLWIASELRGWSLPLRLMLGICTVILAAMVSTIFSQLKAATREHYYGTVLTVLSRESKQGKEKLVANLLASYADHSKEPDRMKAVVELYRNVMAMSAQTPAKPTTTDEPQNLPRLR